MYIEEPIEQMKECDVQLECLYTSFGQLIYKSMEKNALFFCCDDSNREIEELSYELLRKIKYPKKRSPKQGFREAFKVDAVPSGPLKEYSELNNLIFSIKQKLNLLQEQIDNEYSASGYEVASKLKAFQDRVIATLDELTEVLNIIMEKKREFMNDSQNACGVSSGEVEKEFLTEASLNIRRIASNVDGLIEDFRSFLNGQPLVPRQSVESEKSIVDKLSEMDDVERDDTESILRAVENKLYDPELSKDEKLKVLASVFRTIPSLAVDFIYDLILDADELLRKKLIELLSRIDDPAVIQIYRKFISTKTALLRMHGIIGISRWKTEDAKKILIEASKDSDSSVRRLVANCLDYNAGDYEATFLSRLVNDDDDNVARIAIRKCGKFKNRLSFINLIPKLDSNNAKIRKETIEALERLTGTTLGYQYAASERARKPSISRWQELWEKNQTNPIFPDGVKLEKMAPDPVTVKIPEVEVRKKENAVEEVKKKVSSKVKKADVVVKKKKAAKKTSAKKKK